MFELAARVACHGDDGIFVSNHSRRKEMFKFGFDNQDDLELDEESQTDENRATDMSDYHKGAGGAGDPLEQGKERSAGAFREFSLEDLVRHPRTSGSRKADFEAI